MTMAINLNIIAKNPTERQLAAAIANAVESTIKQAAQDNGQDPIHFALYVSEHEVTKRSKSLSPTVTLGFGDPWTVFEVTASATLSLTFITPPGALADADTQAGAAPAE